MLLGSRLATLAAGVVLLIAGRRLYWLLVGLVGFVVGFALAAEILHGPQWVLLAAGLLAGLLASVLAVFFQKLALAVAGFLSGGLAVLWWAEQMGWQEQWWAWVLAFVAGAVGALLVRTLFEMALIVLSSIFGATLILEALQRPVDQITPLFLVLVAVGVVIQAVLARHRTAEKEP